MKYLTGKSNFVHVRQRSQSVEITSGSSHILIPTGKDEFFNVLHVCVFMPIPSKKVKIYVCLPRDRQCPLAYLQVPEASHGLPFGQQRWQRSFSSHSCQGVWCTWYQLGAAISNLLGLIGEYQTSVPHTRPKKTC